MLVLCGKSVRRNRQVILRLGQPRIDLQGISLEHGLLCDVTHRNSLCLFQSPYTFPCCVHRSLRCYKLEICTSHFGRDLLFLCANIFFRDLAPKFGSANSQADLVLLCQWLIDAARGGRIRAQGGRFESLPIIALTANAFPDDVEICREAGMSDFLAKPLRKPALVTALLRALNHVASGDAPLQPELMPVEVEWTDEERQMTGA